MVKYIRENIPSFKNAVIVSPDAGGAKRASQIAHKLGMGFALIHKERKSSNSTSQSPVGTVTDESLRSAVSDLALPLTSYHMTLVGNVAKKECILIDDIADTSHTITKAAQCLVEKGATKVYAIVTHGILSGDAVERIQMSKIDELIVSNTVPQQEHKSQLGNRLKVYDVSGIFSEAIRRIHNGESVSYLFEPVEL
jgi:ribose-phosphate pyrophosphokinase